MKEQEPVAGREITMTRVFNAPRDLVFRLWTDPKHIARWWGPTGFTNTIHEMDVRPGGLWLLTMHGPDGVDYPNRSVYREVVTPERLVWDHGEEGRPDEFRFTVTFEDLGTQTRVSIQMLFKTAAIRNEVVQKYNAVEGLQQNMEKLDDYLARI